MKTFFPFAILLLTMTAVAGSEGMPSMPILKPKKIFKIENTEELESQKGFGNEAPMVNMVNLMMVEGSGMEGMDMAGATLAQTAAPAHSMDQMRADSPSKAGQGFQIEIVSKAETQVGNNNIEFKVTENQKIAKNLKLKAQVYMTSMDMGTENPSVKEIKPGFYQVKSGFSMKGPWAVKIIFPDKTEKVLAFEVGAK